MDTYDYNGYIITELFGSYWVAVNDAPLKFNSLKRAKEYIEIQGNK